MLPAHMIDSIYDAVVDASLWPAAVAEIGAAFKGVPVALLVNDVQSGAVPLFVTNKLEPWSIERFKRDYSTIDRNPMLRAAMTAAEGKALRLPEMLGKSGYDGSAIYNDLIRPLGVRNYLSAVAVRNATTFGGFELFQSPGARQPGRTEVARFEATARHIGRALKLSACFKSAAPPQKSLEAALHRVGMSVFLVDRLGQLCWHNTAAAALLERRDGLMFTGGRLVADDAAEDRGLASAFMRAVDDVVRISRPSGAPALILRLHHLWRSLATPGASIAVFVNDADRDALTLSNLMRAFGLTRAEARIAIALSNAPGIAEAANALGLSPNTVKTTLQRVFAKTDTHSQAELVRLLYSSLFP
ncbi:MAG TPA: hypothetical protein VJ890_13925 [Vineibacter sp.]|nr:hypothetical protein [Vineibacter sp.]